MTETLNLPPPEPVNPPARDLGDWLRRNLFATVGSGIITVITLPIALWIVYKLARYVFVTGRWEIVRVNLRLFLVGRYPADELWRVGVAVAVIACFFGIVAGYSTARRRLADPTGDRPSVARTARDLLTRLWPLVLGVAILLALSSSVGPWVTAAGVVGGAVVGSVMGRAVPHLARPLGGLTAAITVGAVLGYGATTLADGDVGVLDVILMIVALAIGALAALGGLRARTATLPLVLLGLQLFGFLIWFLSRPVGPEGWGGMMLNLFLAVIGITLCFPLGIMLALGRRSQLPIIKGLSVLYIEVIRGVPLYVLLLLSYVALGLFWPAGSANPGLITRAIVVFTIFTAAYVAEIVRGGLQSLPKGQTEASLALGMSQTRTTAFIVMPQALRNVIPALVGQFISLFKDTTLAAAAMSLLDLLSASDAATSQPAFQGQNLSAETIAFGMLLFWVGCITMSRESQRLERRLGVGTR